MAYEGYRPAAPGAVVSGHVIDLAFSVGAAVLLLLWFVLSSDAMLHWLVLPVTVNAVIVGTALSRAVRTREIMDASVIALAFLYHALVLAPYLHVYWDFYWFYSRAPDDMRDWLGYWSILSVFGVIAFLLVERRAYASARASGGHRVLHARRFYVVSIGALSVGTMAYLVMLLRFGGLEGIVSAHELRIGAGATANPFVGMGMLTMLAEFVPVLLGLVAIFVMHRKGIRGPYAVLLVLLAVFVLLVAFGGLRGSRASVVWGMLWTAAVAHYYLYRFRLAHAILGAIFIALFMNVFFYYKRGGLDALVNYFDAGSRAVVVDRVGGYDPVAFTLLHDFGRADIQAMALYRVVTADDYSLTYGRSYMAAVLQIVPREIMPTRPDSFRRERTDLLYGDGAYERDPDAFIPWIFGMPGEALASFGVLAFPLAFAVFGFLVGRVRAATDGWRRRGDDRLFLAPALSIICLLVFLGDSHLYLYSLFKFCGVIFVVLWVSMVARPGAGRA